jgi:hypothetical protein
VPDGAAAQQSKAAGRQAGTRSSCMISG